MYELMYWSDDASMLFRVRMLKPIGTPLEGDQRTARVRRRDDNVTPLDVLDAIPEKLVRDGDNLGLEKVRVSDKGAFAYEEAGDRFGRQVIVD